MKLCFAIGMHEAFKLGTIFFFWTFLKFSTLHFISCFCLCIVFKLYLISLWMPKGSLTFFLSKWNRLQTCSNTSFLQISVSRCPWFWLFVLLTVHQEIKSGGIHMAKKCWFHVEFISRHSSNWKPTSKFSGCVVGKIFLPSLFCWGLLVL